MKKNDPKKTQCQKKRDQASYSSSSLSVSPVRPSNSFIADFLAASVNFAGTILSWAIPESFLCNGEQCVLRRRTVSTYRIRLYFFWRILSTTVSFRDRHSSNFWRWSKYRGRFSASSKLLFLTNTPVENSLIQKSTYTQISCGTEGLN